MKYCLAGIALAVTLTPALAAPAHDSVAAVVQRHQDAFAKKDIKALLADYGDDAIIVISPDVARGKAQIQKVFEGYFAPTAKMGVFDVKLDKVDGDVGQTKWTVNPGTTNAREGNDVFVVRGGKIRFQATYNVHPVAQGAAK